jgi:hypothetical protein
MWQNQLVDVIFVYSNTNRINIQMKKDSNMQIRKQPLGKKILNLFKKFFDNIRAVGIYNWIGIIGLIGTAFGVYITIRYSETTTAIIQIVDWKGRNNDIINQSGSRISILNKEPKSIIDGKVEFGVIPFRYKNKAVKIDFQPAMDYKYLYIKDNKILLNESAELKVYMHGLENIHGYIKQEGTNIGIDSVFVFINANKDLFAYTNREGYFNLSIPSEYQEAEQIIIIQKDGFKPEEKSILLEQMLNRKDIHIYLRQKNSSSI